MAYQTIKIPEAGEKISILNGQLVVPDQPLLPFVEGDGSGPDIWRASQRVFDAAVEKAYHGKRKIQWMEVLAGEKAFNNLGTRLPEDSIDAFRELLVGIRGALTTPAGGGMQSLNVALRNALDLYVCLRPVRYFQGLPSPVKHPEYVDMVVFRENTEDIFTGIELENGTSENKRFKQLLLDQFPQEYDKIRFPKSASLGIKPISKEGTQRLVTAAIRWALNNDRRSVTLVHKGNIMKYTEGSFRNWGYEVAENEFGDRVYTWLQWDRTKEALGEDAANAEQSAALKQGKLLVKDVIADIVFQQTITRAREFDVIATMNLNGDYLSGALAAQVGSIGFAPGGNINYNSRHAVFGATHGTDPMYADKDMANPSSVILSGEMMFRYMGWDEAANLIIKGMERTFSAKTVTYDLQRLIEGATMLNTSEFGDAVIMHMND